MLNCCRIAHHLGLDRIQRPLPEDESSARLQLVSNIDYLKLMLQSGERTWINLSSFDSVCVMEPPDSIFPIDDWQNQWLVWRNDINGPAALSLGN